MFFLICLLAAALIITVIVTAFVVSSRAQDLDPEDAEILRQLETWREGL